MNNNCTLVFDDHAATQLSTIRQFNPIGISDFSIQGSVENAEGSSKYYGFERHSPDPKTINGYCPKSRLSPISSMSNPVFFDLLPEP
jgi:hypothetical protein